MTGLFTGFSLGILILDLGLAYIIMSTDLKEMAHGMFADEEQNLDRVPHIGRYDYHSAKRLSVKDNYAALISQ